MFFFRRTYVGRRVRASRRLYRTRLFEKTSQARGLRLLRSWLSPKQRAQFDAGGQFDVIGSDSGKCYRIRYGTSANVQEVDQDGMLGTGWCFVPMGSLVAGDVMLAQKIALETCETNTLAVANKLPAYSRRDQI
jgi:hypothetical protein